MYKLILAVLIFSETQLLAQDAAPVVFPKVHLLKMDSSSYITNADLKENTNTVFVNFNPTCDHCQRTIASILKNIDKFKDTQIILSSFEYFNALLKFYKDNKLRKFPTVLLGQDQRLELTRQLNYSSFPCSIIFDKNRKWIAKIEGETKAKEYLKILQLK